MVVLVFLFLLFGFAYGIDCNENPEQCSPSNNLFHRNIKLGFCLSGSVSENWQNRPIQGSELKVSGVSLHAMIFFSATYLVVNGGELENDKITGRTLAVHVDTLEVSVLAASQPRYGHGSAIAGSTMYIIGGMSENDQYMSDVFALELGPDPSLHAYSFPANKWAPVTFNGFSTKMARFVTGFWSDVIVLHGGRNDEGALDDVWTLNVVTKTATKLAPSSSFVPSRRFDHCGAVSSGVLYIYGGSKLPSDSTFTALPEFWSFDLTTRKWSSLIQFSSFPRSQASMVYLPACDMFFIIGGISDMDPERNFDRATSSILAISRDDADVSITVASTGSKQPFGKTGLRAVSSGSRVYILGGDNIFANKTTSYGGSNEILEWI